MTYASRIAMAALLLGPLSAQAGEAPRPLVIELFTSEGCSSCPPADALLTTIARDRPDILPLALHVTYWNSLGWRDPFSFDAATGRQRDYAAARGASEIFTPELVVEGRVSVVGSDQAAVAQAIETAARPAGPAIVLARAGEALRVAIAGGDGHGHIELIGYDSQHRTAIGRGENAGRSLIESNIVRAIVPVGDWNGQAMTLTVTPPAGERVAVLLRGVDGAILSAARL